MIGRLRGILVEKSPPQLTLEVGGVGYEIEAPMSTFYKLPDTGNEVVLQVHMVVREDAQLLFGFIEKAEKTLFRSLLKVNGVGPKVALAILSSLTASELVESIEFEDVTRLMQVPGIGKKTAQRLLVELRDKIASEEMGLTSFSPGTPPPAYGVAQTPVADAVHALIALGYKAKDASQAVRAVAEEGDSSEVIIRKALQGIGKQR